MTYSYPCVICGKHGMFYLTDKLGWRKGMKVPADEIKRRTVCGNKECPRKWRERR